MARLTYSVDFRGRCGIFCRNMENDTKFVMDLTEDKGYRRTGEITRYWFWNGLRKKDATNLRRIILPCICAGILDSGFRAGIIANSTSTVMGLDYGDIDLKVIACNPSSRRTLIFSVVNKIWENGTLRVIQEAVLSSTNELVASVVSVGVWDGERRGLFDIELFEPDDFPYDEHIGFIRRENFAFCELVKPEEVNEWSGKK